MEIGPKLDSQSFPSSTEDSTCQVTIAFVGVVAPLGICLLGGLRVATSILFPVSAQTMDVSGL